MAFVDVLIVFLASLLISAAIIYLAARLFGEREGFGTAVLAALIGAIIFGLVSFLLGAGWIASLIGGLAWLIALGSLYDMGLLKTVGVAVLIWIISTVISLVLSHITAPTLQLI